MNLSLPSVRPFLIAGTWQESEPRVPVINPYSGEHITEVCQAQPHHVEQAIQAAVNASIPFKKLSSYARAQALSQLTTLLTNRQEEFAQTICLEAGKPISEARREVGRAINTFDLASEEAKRIPGNVIPLDLSPGTEQHLGMIRRFPIGPVLGITPFNFPLNLVVHKVAPCLAAGNPIVIKPAPQTPLTALLLGEIMLELDLPPGTISIVPCDNHLAEQMVTDDRFRALSFTGSASVGWALKAKAGKKRVILELGGNAGVIIEPDANLKHVAQRCVAGGYAYSGQTCISVQRIFVHDHIYDEFSALLVDHVQALTTGDPQEDPTFVGPLINDPALNRVEEWISEATLNGAHKLTGGSRQGNIIEPTILDNVQSNMKVFCQEVFGPIVTLTRYQDYPEALALLNNSPFGLQAGVFTNDIQKIFHAYQDLEVGTVLANEIPTFRADHMPYGGIKDSGIGREGVSYAIEELTDLKLLVLNLSS
ncbi:MAG: aldehyde dehydrogenase family protein [Nitrospirae bacterium]|nr:aldehyde dehydrogenase family protein [Nitrospirota bacterium]